MFHRSSLIVINHRGTRSLIAVFSYRKCRSSRTCRRCAGQHALGANPVTSQEKAWRILHGDRASPSPRVEAWKIVGDNNAYQALPLNLDVSPTWLQQVGQLLEGVEVRGFRRFAWRQITSDMHHRGGAGSKSGNRRVNCEVRRLIYAQG